MTKKSNNNALTHGLYARETVLPWEDPQAFAAMHEDTRQELNPQGPLEEEAMREVTEQRWRKKRLSMSYLLPYHKNAPAPELIEAAKSGVVGLAAYLVQAANTSPAVFAATTEEVQAYLKAGGTVDRAAASTGKTQRQHNSARNIVEQAYNPASMERYLRAEAMVDSRIGKLMGRLMWLKVYKPMYGQKPLQGLPPAAAPPLAPPANSDGETEPTPIETTTKTRKWGDPD